MELNLIKEGFIKCCMQYLQNLCTWNKCDILFSPFFIPLNS